MSTLPESDPKKRINEGLENLRQLVVDLVRDEQFRDQLTGLRNSAAFEEALAGVINHAREKPFWIAFIEVDRMKRLNDEFSHQRVNVLLRNIADILSTSAEKMFPDWARPYRVSGDEFFMFGYLSETSNSEFIHERLDSIRNNISLISVNVQGMERKMSCTVSIGWLAASDVPLVNRDVMLDCLERVVGFAKREGRNRTERFRPEHSKFRLESVRTSCPQCKAAFSCDDTLEKLHACKTLFCPICGNKTDRPPLNESIVPAGPQTI